MRDNKMAIIVQKTVDPGKNADRNPAFNILRNEIRNSRACRISSEQFLLSGDCYHKPQ